MKHFQFYFAAGYIKCKNMDVLFPCIVIFLFLLAIFDLSVGVSNDAVNFLNSAIGTGVASFKRILIVASIGVFIGAAMSNGMMDIARHGIFRPEHFSFYDLMCIFMAVMVTDILLLDLFNSLGMPTSTTVSMVFELLGATFSVALLKMAGGSGVGLGDMMNTEKALSVIIGIFLSVGIAFFFGVVVQFVTRLIFTFDYRCRLKWKIGLFGGLCLTAIIYFMLIKGAKDLTFMTPVVKGYIADHTALILLCCWGGFSVLMQVLHMLGVNVLKVVVLTGTFALAMAFAGNDLVNFIGVPLSGLAAWQDYAANGYGNASGFLMDSLNAPADTPVAFLVGAGLVMVVSLATSKKARNVSKTEIGLGSQQVGEELFGSSRISRRLVRLAWGVINGISRHTPRSVRPWFDKRFNVDEMIKEPGAAFDLVRGSVNLVLASVLIALGTSLKLPLSTTFVTFMVAMGTSLADRAWGRESAVFRVTGVVSVIGGWFLTAGVAFCGAGIIVLLMYYGGHWMMMALAVLVVFVIVRSNRRFRRRKKEEEGDTLFHAILSTEDKPEVWRLLLVYMTRQQMKFFFYAVENYRNITHAFVTENVRTLGKTEAGLLRQKSMLKNIRRKETICFRMLHRQTAIEKSVWFHLSNSCCMGILYNLRRINEACREHVENNFRPLPSCYAQDFEKIRLEVEDLFAGVIGTMHEGSTEHVAELRHRCDGIKDNLSQMCSLLFNQLQEGDEASMTVLYVYLNLLQETREMVSGLRKYLRAYAGLRGRISVGCQGVRAYSL